MPKVSEDTDDALLQLGQLVASRIRDDARPRLLRQLADTLLSDTKACERLGHAIGVALDKAALTNAKS